MPKERLGNYIQEYSVKNKKDLGYPVYSVTNSQGFCTEYFNKDVSGEDKTTYKIVPRGYFAYNPSRINVGSIDWQNCEDNVIVSPLYVVFKCSDGLNQDYLKYYLKSDSGKRTINARVSGAVRNNLKFSVLSDFELNIGSKEEQQFVVETLCKIEKVIRNECKQLDLYDELVKSRFVEMFGNPVANTKDWNVFPMKDLTTKIGSGATPKGGQESYVKEGISLIRSMNVHNGYFDYEDLAHITKDQADKLSNVEIQLGDVLLNITGASVARCCVVPDVVLPARVNQHVCIIRCTKKILPQFLSNLLVNDDYQALLWHIAGSGATRESITKQQVESLNVILPPLTMQNEFSDFVAQVQKDKEETQKRIDFFKELLSKKTDELFNGESA